MNRPVGRPLKFETPVKMQELIDIYLADTPKKEYTWTGLCLALGTNKVTLEDYRQRAKYKDIVEYGKTMVENSYELSMRETGRAGDIFALKNFGWIDKQEREHTGNKDKPICVKYVDEEDSKLIKEMLNRDE